jgi:hypothetical protein
VVSLTDGAGQPKTGAASQVQIPVWDATSTKPADDQVNLSTVSELGDGQYSLTITSRTAGTYTIVSSATGTEPATYADIVFTPTDVTNPTDPILGGQLTLSPDHVTQPCDGASTPAMALAEVRDDQGDLAAGVEVTFSLIGTDDMTESTVMTDASGIARVEISDPAVYSVRAFVGDVELIGSPATLTVVDSGNCATPTLSITDPTDGAVIDSSHPTISGTADPGATITISVGATQDGLSTADSSGAWSYTLSTALTDGSHTVTASVQGSSPTLESTVTFTVDTSTDQGTPPTPIWLSPWFWWIMLWVGFAWWMGWL